MKRLLLPAVLLLSSAAWADLPPPDTEGCAGKQANASCQTDGQKSGTCTQSRCSRLDYSHGTPPTTMEYDCLKCAASTAPKPATTPPATSDGKSSRGCAAAPGVPLALGALLTVWLTRNKRRGA